jgi:hypothetical protein
MVTSVLIPDIITEMPLRVLVSISFWVKSTWRRRDTFERINKVKLLQKDF